ncbi:hypothetical protein PCASD_15269 [Puccinia coronata f. sp. avenae]|uniref:Uncharacterized protein n=1 Tax=Puccinia coronata f. sp. avenae TaxID=200324 RepID=A0A2N5UGG7_9BASI|nr:hypothetical protein PCASD_15269 [Puccinia coronata f. sp. avenae]
MQTYRGSRISPTASLPVPTLSLIRRYSEELLQLLHFVFLKPSKSTASSHSFDPTLLLPSVRPYCSIRTASRHRAKPVHDHQAFKPWHPRPDHRPQSYPPRLPCSSASPPRSSTTIPVRSKLTLLAIVTHLPNRNAGTGR